jgi:RNA polymerase sigma-70 factor (ECF subfamily)
MTASDSRERFAALLRQHGDAVFAAARRFARDRSDAEDLWQETALAAWIAFAELAPDRDPRPWLRTIAIRKAIDRLRRDATRPVADAVRDVAALAARPVSARVDFEDELAALPPLERAALLLRYQEGRTVADVAALLQVAEGTVKSWLFRAREALRPRFADECRSRKDGARP